MLLWTSEVRGPGTVGDDGCSGVDEGSGTQGWMGKSVTPSSVWNEPGNGEEKEEDLHFLAVHRK